MARFAIYDSKAVDVVICGIPITDGLAEDEFLSVAADEEAFGEAKGADGEVIRYATHNRLHTVELTLKQTSIHNAQLMALHVLDVNAPGGAGVGPFLVKDNNSSTLLAGAQCWIKKHPDMTRGKTVGEVTWQIKVVAPVGAMFIGSA